MLGTMVRLILASPPTYATKLGTTKAWGLGSSVGWVRRRDQGEPARMSLFLTPDAAYIGRGLLICSIPRRAFGLAQPSGQGDRVFAHPWTCSGHRRARVGVEGRRGLLGRSPVTTTSSTGFVAAPRSVLRNRTAVGTRPAMTVWQRILCLRQSTRGALRLAQAAFSNAAASEPRFRLRSYSLQPNSRPPAARTTKKP